MNLPRLTLSFFCPKGEAFHVAARRMRGRTLIHCHAFSEVFWIEDGTCQHLINGQRQSLKPGSLVTMRRDDYHGFYSPANGPGFNLVNIAFPHSTVEFFRQRYFAASTSLFWAATKVPFSLQLSPAQRTRLGEWSDQLARGPRTQLAIDRFLLELLLELQTKTPATATAPAWLQHALREIHDPKHFTGGTARLARLAGRSPQHVNYALKQFYHLTATEAVNRARMEHAATELMMTTKKIIDIALECGFENLGHFYKVFRTHHGVTPRLYRERQRAMLP